MDERMPKGAESTFAPKEIFSGKQYPNGYTKSQLLEGCLNHHDFQCPLKDYLFDLAFTKREEENGKETCHWFRDSSGRYIVADLQLAQGEIEITPDGFKRRPKSIRVCIIYAREDGGAAAKIYSVLRERGFDVWFDAKSLLPGDAWELKIQEAIKKSDFVIALLSETSLKKRGFFQAELRQVLEVSSRLPPSERFLIPARLDRCKPAHPAFRERQWVDLFLDWDAGISQIEETLRANN